MPATKELMPRPTVIRERLAEIAKERRALRALLRASEIAARDGNPGGLMPPLPTDAYQADHRPAA